MRYLLTILLLSLLTGCVYESPRRYYEPYGYVNAAEPVEYYRVVQTFTGPMEVPVYYDEPYYYNPYYGPGIRGDVHIRLDLLHRGHRHREHHDRTRYDHRERHGQEHRGNWHHRHK